MKSIALPRLPRIDEGNAAPIETADVARCHAETGDTRGRGHLRVKRLDGGADPPAGHDDLRIVLHCKDDEKRYLTSPPSHVSHSGRIAPATPVNAPSSSSATRSRAGSTGPGIRACPFGMRLKPDL